MQMSFRIYSLGDQAITVDWGNSIDPDRNDRVYALFQYFKRKPLPGMHDLVPAYSSLSILFDPEAVWRHAPGILPSETLREELEQAVRTLDLAPAGPARHIRIPVCYHPSLAPDLESVAARSGLRPEAVVALHTSREYRVYMLGFLPGFAYLGSVDARIAAPRLAAPRVQVPTGSVGIAGEQTGIYPLESPGGWNLIGRTPVRMFDPGQSPPTLLLPGDRVRFEAISLQQFHRYATSL